MDSKTLDCIVFDAGAHTTRAGRAEDFPGATETPHIVVPSCVSSAGDIDNTEQAASTSVKQVFDSTGRISNWEALEVIYEYLLYEQLGWPEGDEGFVLCTENVPCMPRSDREYLTQTLFETFNVKGCYLLDSSVASLYAAGKTDGIVVDVGHTGTNVVQISDGAAVVGTSERYPVGGAVLDDFLDNILKSRSINLSSEHVKRLKEMCTEFADSQESFLEEQASRQGPGAGSTPAAVQGEGAEAAPLEADPGKAKGATKHVLPDGQEVTIQGEGLHLGEALIRPSLFPPWLLMSSPPVGVADAAFSCAMICSSEGRQSVLDNVLLCGGCSTAKNFQQRFLSELRALVSSTANVGKLSIPEYMPKGSKYAAYCGAAVVAKTIGANHMLSKEDYEDRGPAFMHKKFEFATSYIKLYLTCHKRLRNHIKAW